MPDVIPIEDSATSRRFAPPKQSEPTDNPLAGGLNISVFVPEAIEIKMVDASVLSDYEIWGFIASLLSSVTIGFWVSYTQAVDSGSPTCNYILLTTKAFGVLFLIAILTAYKKRQILSRKSKSVKLSVTAARNSN